MRAVVNNKVYPDGSGRNKKEAKQNAAKNALNGLENDDEPVNIETNPHPFERFSNVTQANYVCWLNEYGQKKRSPFIPKETTKMSLDPNSQICLYACKYVCGDKEFPEAVCRGKKDAKEAAAKLVYEEFFKEQKSEVPDENDNGEENTNINNLNASFRHLKMSSPTNTENTTADKNFIGILNEYCQKAKLVNDFIAVEIKGPAHDPEFAYKVVINKKEYAEGRGKSAKEAKQIAAQLAWSELQEQSDWNSPISVKLTGSSLLSSLSETTDDVSSSQKMSESPSTNESDSPYVPEQRILDVKPKRKLAANFQLSPVSRKEEQPGINALKTAKPSTKSTTVSSPSTKSRFVEDFDSITPAGKGGFGYVFKARRKYEDKFYAVKIVKFNEKALREVSALANFDHANIVRYYTSWTEDTAYKDESSESYSSSSSGSGSEFLYIQMQFCEGETLREWIEKRNIKVKQSLELRQKAAQIIKQVLKAVKYVHYKKLIHRDLKPANIMFGHDEEIKVGDFGLVTEEEGENDEIRMERTKRAGTQSYMSPEQRQENTIYDRKVDIFPLGLIYFELLWRFGTQNEKQKLWGDIRRKMFPEQFHVKFGFEHKLIEQMLCGDPENRPDASELLSQLERDVTAFLMNQNVHRENRTY